VSDRCRRRRRRNGRGIGQGAWLARHGAASSRPCPTARLAAIPQPRKAQGPRSYHGPPHASPGAGPQRPHASAAPDCTHVALDNIDVDFENILRRGGVDIFIGPPHKWDRPGRPCPSRTKFAGKSQNKALRYPYRLTQRPNLPIILKDSPKSGQKWLKPINLPRATQPAVARVALKAQRTSPR
jgi:hypothetical protein